VSERGGVGDNKSVDEICLKSKRVNVISVCGHYLYNQDDFMYWAWFGVEGCPHGHTQFLRSDTSKQHVDAMGHKNYPNNVYHSSLDPGY
jgi:hypothetical protein